MINYDGMIMAAYHVVEGAQAIEVAFAEDHQQGEGRQQRPG